MWDRVQSRMTLDLNEYVIGNNSRLRQCGKIKNVLKGSFCP